MSAARGRGVGADAGADELAAQLKTLDGFRVADGKLCKTFRFHNFEDAFAWMTRVAARAEEQNHHPEWTNVYNRVEVALITHDANAITDRDFQLARTMNELARDLQRKD